MVDRSDGARFALKPVVIVGDHPLDRDGAIQASIARFVDLTHTSRADQRLDFVWAKLRTGSEDHVVSVDSIVRVHLSTQPGPGGGRHLIGIRTRRSTPTY
jgi:hypothetical protein